LGYRLSAEGASVVGASGQSFSVTRSRAVHKIGRDNKVETAFIIGAVLLATMIGAAGLLSPVHLIDLRVRAGIETIITLCTIAAGVLLLIQFRRTRHGCDLLLLGALVTVGFSNLTFSALPDLTGSRTAIFGADAHLVLQVLLPIAFAVAAFAPTQTVGRRAWRPALMAIGCVAPVLLAELIDIVIGRGIASTASYDSLTLWVAVASSAILVIAGLVLARRSKPAGVRAGMLAGAAFLIAAARLQYAAIPVVAADWITAREALRLAGYGLLLVAVAREYICLRRAEQQAAVQAERQRIARDLHDGLAQDLAVIAIQGQRLESELGPEHPLTVAARRALAASRGTILDLSASEAPNTQAALRAVADELEARFGVEITVHAELANPLADLSFKSREHVVRIAREAIVNAVGHGAAQHVEVALESRATRWLLRVSDDGCGIQRPAPASPAGFGLAAMHARAAELGGHLTLRRRPTGGTELEVSLAEPPPN
jgi:signal transduction histidine kinase